MLKIQAGDLIFIGLRVSAEEPDDAPGWVLAGRNGLFISLTSAAYFWDDDMDYEKSIGRRLQESESVMVRFTDARR